MGWTSRGFTRRITKVWSIPTKCGAGASNHIVSEQMEAAMIPTDPLLT
jgi:hypothetical protein